MHTTAHLSNNRTTYRLVYRGRIFTPPPSPLYQCAVPNRWRSALCARCQPGRRLENVTLWQHEGEDTIARVPNFVVNRTLSLPSSISLCLFRASTSKQHYQVCAIPNQPRIGLTRVVASLVSARHAVHTKTEWSQFAMPSQRSP